MAIHFYEPSIQSKHYFYEPLHTEHTDFHEPKKVRVFKGLALPAEFRQRCHRGHFEAGCPVVCYRPITAVIAASTAVIVNNHS